MYVRKKTLSEPHVRHLFSFGLRGRDTGRHRHVALAELRRLKQFT